MTLKRFLNYLIMHVKFTKTDRIGYYRNVSTINGGFNIKYKGLFYLLPHPLYFIRSSSFSRDVLCAGPKITPTACRLSILNFSNDCSFVFLLSATKEFSALALNFNHIDLCIRLNLFYSVYFLLYFCICYFL